MMHDDYGYFRGKLDDFLQFLSDNFILEKTYQGSAKISFRRHNSMVKMLGESHS
jgi:hypothetical protein